MNTEKKLNRIVYGAACTWWNSADKADKIEGTGSLRCPYCKMSAVEIEENDGWWKGVYGYTGLSDPEYERYVEWLRGRCFSTIRDSVEEFWYRFNREKLRA